MKALPILREFRNMKLTSILGEQSLKQEVIERIDEAIKELEALDERSCDRCKHNDTILKQCQLPYMCIRQLFPSVGDYFEPKE